MDNMVGLIINARSARKVAGNARMQLHVPAVQKVIKVTPMMA